MEAPYIEINGKRFPVGGGEATIKFDNAFLHISDEVATEIKEWVESGRSVVRGINHTKCPACGYVDEEHLSFCGECGSRMDVVYSEPHEVDRWHLPVEDVGASVAAVMVVGE